MVINDDDLQDAFIDLVNNSRAIYYPVRKSAVLYLASLRHATWMDKYKRMLHQSISSGSPKQRVDKAGGGYSVVGEVISAGQKTLAQVFDSWVRSPGHHRILHDKNYTHAGIAVIGSCWCAVFGKSVETNDAPEMHPLHAESAYFRIIVDPNINIDSTRLHEIDLASE